MKRICLYLSVLALALQSAMAETAEVSGNMVTYTGATASWVDGELVLTYSRGEVPGTLVLPQSATTRMLLVGGGGAGGALGTGVSSGAAGGGGAGGVFDKHVLLMAGAYEITVGKGGQRVETVRQSWNGANGENTMIRSTTDGLDFSLAVLGGGGGGSVKALGQGTNGGSGGGGAWYVDAALPGGTAAEGYGWAGGTPASNLVGGGGGGANEASAQGHGGAEGEAGAGRASDITGESLTYAAGGRGGSVRSPFEAADGVRCGDGGDGATVTAAGTGAFGGAGHDGVLIVRISALFTHEKVAYPTYTQSAEWSDGANLVAFDFEAQSDDFKAAVESVTGVTNIVCSVTDNGATTNTLGRQQFVVTLKEGFLWDNGTASGSSAPCVCAWRVKEPNVIGDASVEVKKTVDWVEGRADAKITIDVHVTPERKEHVPNVLIIGSLCGAHGLTSDVINSAINAVTEVGNVDYYYFNRCFDLDGTSSHYGPDNDAYFSGSLAKGQKRSGSVYGLNPNNGDARVDVGSCAGNHSGINGFYHQLYELIAGKVASKYDYIIFSFDRSRVVERFHEIPEHEAEVVEFLKPYYDRNAVIWLVDNRPPNATWTYNGTSYTYTETPWYPNQLAQYQGSGSSWQWTSLDAGVDYWKSSNSTINSWVNEGVYAYYAYNALVGLFYPKGYPVDKDNYKANVVPEWKDGYAASPEMFQKVRNTAFPEATNQVTQVVYDNAVKVAETISKVVLPGPSTVDMNDNVNVNLGLDLQGASAKWTTNGVDGVATDSSDLWTALTADELIATQDGVQIALTNVVNELWIKLVIDVTDNGTFRSSENAQFNESTGKWEKDPNDGPVVVTMTKNGTDIIQAQDEASTAIPWSFNAFKVKGTVVYGKGDIYVDGFSSAEVSVCEGMSPEVIFQGATGYVLDYLEVDGQVLAGFEPAISRWVFAHIAANHEIKVGFSKVDMKLLRAQQRYPWNNLVDIDYFIGGNPEQPAVTFARLVFFVEYEDPANPAKRIRRQLKTFRDNENTYLNWPFAAETPFYVNDHNQLRSYGYHRVTWDSNADGVSIFQRKKVKYFMYACQGSERPESGNN